MPYKSKERRREAVRAWAKANPEKKRVYDKKYRAKNMDKHVAGIVKWQKKNPDRIKAYDLKNKHGMKLEQYEEMFAKQIGLCGICNNPEKGISKNGKTKRLAVDHCHKTGKIRGLLCENCNRAIGLLKDSVDITMKAASYLSMGGV